MENADERYEDCDRCEERYSGEDAIRSYLHETPSGRKLCLRCWEFESLRAVAVGAADSLDVAGLDSGFVRDELAKTKPLPDDPQHDALRAAAILALDVLKPLCATSREYSQVNTVARARQAHAAGHACIALSRALGTK